MSWSSSIDGVFNSGAAASNGSRQFVYDALSPGSHVVTLTVTDSSSLTVQELVVFDVVANQPPSIVSVSIDPDPATVNDTLNCSYSGYADPEGDPDASTMEWTISGAVVGTGSSLIGVFERDDLVECTVTPDDGEDAGSPVSASTTIVNSLPTIASVEVSPATAYVTDSLDCSYTGFNDADGDGDQSTYEWLINLQSSGVTTASLTSGFAKGDEVGCLVFPYDGIDTAGSVSSPTVNIANTPPVASGITISPASPSAGDVLDCTYGYFDADGDNDQTSIEWFVNTVSAGNGASLAGGYQKGDTVECVVTPGDGDDSGTPESASVLIENATPSVFDVRISPDPGYSGDTLTCIYGFDDSDLDSDNSTIAWEVNGTPSGTGATFSGNIGYNELVACSVTPNDGTVNGTTVTASLTVSNTIPVVTSVVISPSDPLASEALDCSWTYTDPDAQNDLSLVEWTVGSTVVGTDVSLSSGFVTGDTVTCTVTAFDGQDVGVSESDTVTIRNTPPSVTSVSMTAITDHDLDGDDQTAGVNDTLSCSWIYSDLEGDQDLSTVAWTNSGGAQIGTGPTLSAAFTRGEKVTCTVTPYDGNGTGTPVSAEIKIENSPPTITSVSLLSTSGTSQSPITAVPEGYDDPDNDAASYLYAWTIDGLPITHDTATLSVGLYAGAVVVATIRPTDGEDEGPPVASAPFTVLPMAEVYPAPTGRASDLWEVEVAIDGSWVDAGALQYSRRSQDPHFHGSGYSHTDPSGPTGGGFPRTHWATIGVETGVSLPIRITRKTGTLTGAEVLPTRFGIVPTVDLGLGEIEFSLSQGDKLYIATNDQDFETLFLFANPVENPPDPGPSVHTFGPGEHVVGYDWSPAAEVDTIVIAGGAWVIGSIDITTSPSATFQITGNGILSGEFDTYENVKYYNNDPTAPRPYSEKIDNILVHTDYQVSVPHEVHIDGITALASPYFNFQVTSSPLKTFTHVAILNPWNYNSDGFNAKSNLTVANCFAFNNDDKLHAEYVNAGPVEAYDNVLAGRNSFLIGYGYFTGNKVYEAVIEDQELILQENRVPFRARVDARENVTPGVFDPATDVVVENQTYRNIVIEGDVDQVFYLGIEHTVWGYGNPVVTGPVYGNVRDLLFENIEVRGTPGRKSVIFGIDSANQMGTPAGPITIRNLVIDGVPVTDTNKDTYFDIGPYAYVVFEQVVP